MLLCEKLVELRNMKGGTKHKYLREHRREILSYLSLHGENETLERRLKSWREGYNVPDKVVISLRRMVQGSNRLEYTGKEGRDG